MNISQHTANKSGRMRPKKLSPDSNPDGMVIPKQHGRMVRIDERTWIMLRPGRNIDEAIKRIEGCRELNLKKYE